MLGTMFHIIVNPTARWMKMRDTPSRTLAVRSVVALLLFGGVAPVASYFGTTTMGWRIGTGDSVRLTPDSAFDMALAFYAVILVASLTVGKLIHWMSSTYGAKQPLARALALAVYSAAPLYLIGIVQLYPVLWFNFLLGLPALAYTVYLLHCGVPIMMDISKERAFLFSNGIVTVGLVMLVGLLALTAGLWGIGVGPQFEVGTGS